MQIIFRATTATTAVAGEAITTSRVQILPIWAPPIEYIGTTGPWMAYILGPGETTIPGNYVKIAKSAHVRAYGRRATLHDGRECVALSRDTYGTADHMTDAVLIILTYRAVGELTRP